MLAKTSDLLSQSDTDLFTNGGCHVFAVCLFEVFKFPVRLLRDSSKPIPGGIVHVYCLPDLDVMIDFHGKGSERSYLKRKRYDFHPYFSKTISIGGVEAFYVREFGRGGLYAEPQFLEIARNRAFEAIAVGKSNYEYAPEIHK